MATAKLFTFNNDLIRSYVENDRELLEAGIYYLKNDKNQGTLLRLKAQQASLPFEDLAKETVIQIVQDRCYSQWHYMVENHSALNPTEYSVYRELRPKLFDNGIEKFKEAQKEEKREAEREAAEDQRIKELKEYCEKYNLDFETENQKYLEEKEKETKKGWLLTFLGIGIVLFAIIYFLFFDYESIGIGISISTEIS